jgi:hypothetical protein
VFKSFILYQWRRRIEEKLEDQGKLFCVAHTLCYLSAYDYYIIIIENKYFKYLFENKYKSCYEIKN